MCWRTPRSTRCSTAPACSRGQTGRAPSQRLTLGTTFGMDMKMGVRYSTVSTVVEFGENRLIAWQTGPKGKLERYVAGRIWRYELEPLDGGTLVRETWTSPPIISGPCLKLGDLWSGKTRRDMELTLARLDNLLTAPLTAPTQAADPT